MINIIESGETVFAKVSAKSGNLTSADDPDGHFEIFLKNNIPRRHSKSLEKTALIMEVNGELKDLSFQIKEDSNVKIITSKNISPSLHWLSTTKTGKARAAIRRHWQAEDITKKSKYKVYILYAYIFNSLICFIFLNFFFFDVVLCSF